jgi:type IV secretion system protein VirB2
MKLSTGHLVGAAVVLAMIASPALAQTGGGNFAPVDNALNFVVQALQGTIARSAAIIAVVALGYLAIVGRISWFLAVSVVLGIALIFGAASIVDAVKGSVGT